MNKLRKTEDDDNITIYQGFIQIPNVALYTINKYFARVKGKS